MDSCEAIRYLIDREISTKGLSDKGMVDKANDHEVAMIPKRKEVWKKFFKSIPVKKLNSIKLKLTIPKMERQQAIELAASVGRNIDRPNIVINGEEVLGWLE